MAIKRNNPRSTQAQPLQGAATLSKGTIPSSRSASSSTSGSSSVSPSHSVPLSSVDTSAQDPLSNTSISASHEPFESSEPSNGLLVNKEASSSKNVRSYETPTRLRKSEPAVCSSLEPTVATLQKEQFGTPIRSDQAFRYFTSIGDEAEERVIARVVRKMKKLKDFNLGNETGERTMETVIRIVEEEVLSSASKIDKRTLELQWKRFVLGCGSGRPVPSLESTDKTRNHNPDFLLLSNAIADSGHIDLVRAAWMKNDVNKAAGKGPLPRTPKTSKRINGWEQIGVVGELKPTWAKFAAGRAQLQRRFQEGYRVPIRSHCLGFVMGENGMRLYLLTPSGYLESSKLHCKIDLTIFPRFLLRLANLNDVQLGILESRSDVLDPSAPFRLSPQIFIEHKLRLIGSGVDVAGDEEESTNANVPDAGPLLSSSSSTHLEPLLSNLAIGGSPSSSPPHSSSVRAYPAGLNVENLNNEEDHPTVLRRSKRLIQRLIKPSQARTQTSSLEPRASSSNVDASSAGSTLTPRKGPAAEANDSYKPPGTVWVAMVCGVDITRVAFRRIAYRGRSTTTFETSVAAKPPSNGIKGATSVSFVDKTRMETHDKIRELIGRTPELEREGIARTKAIFRGEFWSSPIWYGVFDDTNLTTRAMEISVFPECYRNLNTVRDIEELAEVARGVIKGLAWLNSKGILHRDVSAGNIMIDSKGAGILIDYNLAVFTDQTEARSKEKSGTFMYLPRCKLPQKKGELDILHETWHDLESVYYVVWMTVLHKSFDSKSLSDSKAAREEADAWKGSSALLRKDTLRYRKYRDDLLDLCPPEWQGIYNLTEIFRQNCGLSDKVQEQRTLDLEEDVVSQLWTKGEMSYETVLKDINSFIDSLETL